MVNTINEFQERNKQLLEENENLKKQLTDKEENIKDMTCYWSVSWWKGWS